MAVGETSGQGPQRRVVSAGGGRRRPASESTPVEGAPDEMPEEATPLVKEADPATPVEVLGLQGLPMAGDTFHVIADDAKARQMAQYRQDKARDIGKFIKNLGLKGVSHQVQGDQLRVSGKKRDDLQDAIQAMREHDFGIPLQFSNYRD